MTATEAAEGAGRVDLYWGELSDILQAWAWKILDQDERRRANRFAYLRDRARFCSGRARLRIILSEYLGVRPDQVALRHTSAGKPYVATEDALAGTPHFNLSHSERICVIGVCWDSEVGIDVEPVARNVGRGVERYFAAPERRALRSLSGDRRSSALARAWTAKEALAKARGRGLDEALGVQVVEVVDGVLGLRRTIDAGWNLHEVPAPHGYVASCVTRLDALTVRLCQHCAPGNRGR